MHRADSSINLVKKLLSLLLTLSLLGLGITFLNNSAMGSVAVPTLTTNPTTIYACPASAFDETFVEDRKRFYKKNSENAFEPLPFSQGNNTQQEIYGALNDHFELVITNEVLGSSSGVTCNTNLAIATSQSMAFIHKDNGGDTFSTGNALQTSSAGYVVKVIGILPSTSPFLTLRIPGNTNELSHTLIVRSAPKAVTFDKNAADAAGSMSVQSASNNSALTANSFTRTGFVFTGWATSAAGPVEYLNGGLYNFASASGDVDLFANWAPEATASTGPGYLRLLCTVASTSLESSSNGVTWASYSSTTKIAVSDNQTVNLQVTPSCTSTLKIARPNTAGAASVFDLTDPSGTSLAIDGGGFSTLIAGYTYQFTSMTLSGAFETDLLYAAQSPKKISFTAPTSATPITLSSGPTTATISSGTTSIATYVASEAVTWEIATEGTPNPSLFSIDSATGALSFTSTPAAGVYQVTIRASQVSDINVTSTFLITVTVSSNNNNGNNSSSTSTPPTPTINLSNLNGSGSNGSGGALATASAGQTFTLTGNGMNNVNQVNVGDRRAIITLKTATRLGFKLPKNLRAGTYDLSLYGSFGSMTEAKFFSVAKKKIKKKVAGFGGNSPALNKVVKSGISRTMARLGGGVRLVCNGSTSGVNVTKAAKKLARDRARAACAYAKRANPSLTTKIRISPASAVGAKARNVKLVYRNY